MSTSSAKEKNPITIMQVDNEKSAYQFASQKEVGREPCCSPNRPTLCANIMYINEKRHQYKILINGKNLSEITWKALNKLWSELWMGQEQGWMQWNRLISSGSASEKLTYERIILKKEQRTKSALTGGICYGTVSLPNATMIAKSPKTRSFIRFIIRDTTGFKKPWCPVVKCRNWDHQGPSRFPKVSSI